METSTNYPIEVNVSIEETGASCDYNIDRDPSEIFWIMKISMKVGPFKTICTIENAHSVPV